MAMVLVRCRWQGWVAGVCLLFCAGCASGKRWGSGGHDKSHPPPSSSLATPGSDTPERKLPDVTPVEVPPPGYRISEDDPLVAERASFFERILNDWRETTSQLTSRGEVKDGASSWRDCLLSAEQALSGYHSLQTGQNRGVNPWQVVARDLGYYQKGCDQVFAALKAQGTAAQDQPPLILPEDDGVPAQLRHHYDSGDFLSVIATYETMVRSQEEVKLSRDTRGLYGRSLVKTGRFADAARIYTEILAESGQSNDLATLEFRLETGDVLLAAGRVDDARQVYQGQVQLLAPLVSQNEWAEAHALAFAEQVAAEDVDQYRQMMQAYLQFDGKQVPSALTEGVAVLERRPPGPLLDLARMMLARIRKQAQAWARGQLTEVRSLIDARELEQASALLEQITVVAPPEIMAAISQLQTEIVQAQALKQMVPGEAVVPESVDPWKEAMALFEQRKYDEAIAGFRKFAGTDRDAESQAKIAEAVELAASALRRQAAALFAKARNTFDPEIKRQTLQKSRLLLEELIEKYPQSAIVGKARQNLQVIDAELGLSSSAPLP